MTVNVPTASDIEARIQLRMGGRLVPITDLTPISPTRQFVKSVVVEEIAAVWRGLAEANDRWFLGSPTATVADVARRVADFGGPANPGPTFAYGDVLQLTVSADYDLAAGTQFSTAPASGTPVVYAVLGNTAPNSMLGDLGDGSWHLTANVQRTVTIQALVAGSGGNTSANTISVAVNPVPNLLTIGNLSVGNGVDALDAAGYWNLFKSWLLSLKGSTPGALLYAIQYNPDGTPRDYNGKRVSAVALQAWDGISSLTVPGGDGTLLNGLVYISEGIGATQTGAALASSALVAAVTALLQGDDTPTNPGLIDAGLPCAVLPASAMLVPVTVVIDIDPNYGAATVLQAVTTAINSYFASLAIGGTSVTGASQGQVVFAHLFKSVTDVPGVLAAVFSAPTVDVAVPTGYQAVAGQMTVTGTVVND